MIYAEIWSNPQTLSDFQKVWLWVDGAALSLPCVFEFLADKSICCIDLHHSMGRTLVLGWGELLSHSISWLTDHTWIDHFFLPSSLFEWVGKLFHLLCKRSWKPVGETQYSTARELQFSVRVIFWRRDVTQSILYWKERRNMGFWFSCEWRNEWCKSIWQGSLCCKTIGQRNWEHLEMGFFTPFATFQSEYLSTARLLTKFRW